MPKFLFLIYKDYLLLIRDKIGLCVLFLMPMFFVFAITLLQVNHSPAQKSFSILLANFDQADTKLDLKSAFSAKSYKIEEIMNPDSFALKQAQQKVSHGKYKLLIVIPFGASKQILTNTQQSITNTESKNPSPLKIELFFDPGVNPGLKEAIVMQINSILQTQQKQIMKNILGDVLGTTPSKAMKAPIPLEISYAGNNVIPNVVQQNIPAWALFGMFFIALPLASIMIKEREQSVTARIRISPVSSVSILAARLIAFVSINFLQLWLMLCVGIFVMPFFHLPSLNVSHHLSAIILVGLFVSFAATSFGLLIGSVSKTIEQASSLVPILIVLAAALGGIMIPTYLMSDSMQSISVFSPLHWGHQAFIDVLLRDFTITQILLPLTKLGLFSVITSGFALWLAND